LEALFTKGGLAVQAHPFPWHADAPNRRRKTWAETLEGHEFIEAYDRRFPGKLAARGAL